MEGYIQTDCILRWTVSILVQVNFV